MLRECIYGECAHEQHVRRTVTLTLTHTITAYSVSGNVVRVRILICATGQKPCRKRADRIIRYWPESTDALLAIQVT